MLSLNANAVNLRTVGDVDAALQHAVSEAGATGGQHLPAILFQQGRRLMVTTAFPIRFVQSHLKLNAATRKGNVEQVLLATNRPTMPDHVENVKSYLGENIGGTYIIPPMTLNVRQAISIYAPAYASTSKICYMVLPANARLEITDGGHRKAAIDKLLEELDEDRLNSFYQDAVSVMITVEADPARIHQDFADCSKTKALPKSLLAAYDRRNPANGLVLDLIEGCPLFKGKIDSTSSTLSKLSTKLFLTNQIRQMVKELLVGSYALADDAFEEKAKQILGSSEDSRYTDARTKFKDYLERVTAAIPVLAEIAKIGEGIPSNRVTELRSEGWVCLTATGLNVIGRIGHDLFKHERPDWTLYADRLGKIDWNRTADIWQGNIVQSGKVMTQQNPVRDAVKAVRAAIGL